MITASERSTCPSKFASPTSVGLPVSAALPTKGTAAVAKHKAEIPARSFFKLDFFINIILLF